MADPEQYEVIYFDGMGRGEMVRLCLVAAGKKFKDTRLSDAEFDELKAAGTFPCGQVPCLRMAGGVVLNDSMAICTYLARVHGLEGADPLETAKGMGLVFAIEDVQKKWSAAFWGPEENKAAGLAAMREPITVLAGKLERNIRGPFVLGNKMSLADIIISYQLGTIFRDLFDVSPFPKVQQVIKSVNETPAIAAYLAKRPVTEW